MKNLFITLCTLFVIQVANANTADSSRSVQVGDSVVVSACPTKGYVYLQYYQKTRFPSVTSTYNKTTGEDFYEYFFLDGDFDAKPLPCSYGNKKYRIIGFRTLVDKNTGADRPVMFLDLGPNTVLWVELNGAVESVEVFLE
jgi:hypothetical protein